MLQEVLLIRACKELVAGAWSASSRAWLYLDVLHFGLLLVLLLQVLIHGREVVVLPESWAYQTAMNCRKRAVR